VAHLFGEDFLARLDVGGGGERLYAELALGDTQLPLAAPSRSAFTAGLALMNTSPSAGPALPLICMASSVDPALKPWKVDPVAWSNRGPRLCSIRLTSEPS
jgi:hypothetical protein